MTNHAQDLKRRRSCGAYLDAGDFWITSEDNGIKFINPIGHPALGEALRVLAHQRVELLAKLAKHEQARVAALAEEA